MGSPSIGMAQPREARKRVRHGKDWHRNGWRCMAPAERGNGLARHGLATEPKSIGKEKGGKGNASVGHGMAVRGNAKAKVRCESATDGKAWAL